jgi:CheY-like chemotaxis protein
VRLLVVDDEPDITLSMAQSFRALDATMEVLTAHSGDAAQALLEKDASIDAVISDIKMPGMSGLELLAWMRRAQHPATRILLTAFEPTTFSPQEMSDAGPVAVFTKPANLRQMLSLLHSAKIGPPAAK